MSRIPELVPADMTKDQRRIHDAILGGPRGVVRGPVKVWIHNPGLAEPAQALGAYCRFGTSLPQRLSELAILVTAVHWRAGYEWSAHAPLARKGGVSEPVLEAVRTGREPPSEQEDERVVHQFSLELLNQHAVSNETWDRAMSALGMGGLIDLIGILGYYGLISMTIKAFEIGTSPREGEMFGD